MILAITQQQQIDVPENSWIGHTTMAGFGIILLVLSFLCIKGNKKGQQMFLWGGLTKALMTKAVQQPTSRMMTKVHGGPSEGFDWRSAMTFLVGMWAMTSIVSSTGGFVVDMVGWFQGLVMALADWPILSDIGAGGICLFLRFLAMRNKDDDKQDLMYGAICGFFFPLGGGTWAEITLQIGNWIPQLMQSPFH